MEAQSCPAPGLPLPHCPQRQETSRSRSCLPGGDLGTARLLPSSPTPRRLLPACDPLGVSAAARLSLITGGPQAAGPGCADPLPPSSTEAAPISHGAPLGTYRRQRRRAQVGVCSGPGPRPWKTGTPEPEGGL